MVTKRTIVADVMLTNPVLSAITDTSRDIQCPNKTILQNLGLHIAVSFHTATLYLNVLSHSVQEGPALMNIGKQS
jgi:hypothetical protein